MGKSNSVLDFKLFEYLQTYLTDRRRELFRKVLAERTRHFTVVTEDVYQLHNTSAVMRSCDVFGIQDLHVVEEDLGKRIDKEIAMGAQKWVSLHRHDTIKSCIKTLKDRGYQIMATSPHNNSLTLADFDVTRKTAFLFGQEGEGLSEEALGLADGCMRIPMFGFTESLNISVSVAIILQSIVTRLRDTEVSWQLSEDEKMVLEMEWTQKSIKSVSEIINRYHQAEKKL